MSQSAKYTRNLAHYSNQWRVISLAALSRALALAFLVVCGRLGAPYDTSLELLRGIGSNATGNTAAVAWDAVFYQRIAEEGYEYEQFHAFFPLLPFLARLLQNTVFAGWDSVSSFQAAAVLISWLSFVTSAWLLGRITQHVFKSPDLTSAAVLFYCFTPASVFHAAAYTESLFGALTLLGIYFVYCRHSYLAASLAFSLSSAVRSNGVVNAGFILHSCAQHIVRAVRAKRWVAVTALAAHAIVGVVLIFAPLAGLQYFGFRQFCTNPSYQDNPRPWCTAFLPYVYGFVQKHYWHVGFLKYFTLQQVPNFLLAAPILLLSAYGVASFATQNVDTMLSLGLLEQPLQNDDRAVSKLGVVAKSRNEPLARGTGTRSSGGGSGPSGGVSGLSGGVSGFSGGVSGLSGGVSGLSGGVSGFSGGVSGLIGGGSAPSTPPECWLPSHASVFIFHWAFLTLVAFLVMHVQVSTRFLSCSPAVYWYMAHLWVKKKQRWLWTYCFSYMALGSLLFANFLPWT